MNYIQNKIHTNLWTNTETKVRTAQRLTELFKRSISCPTKIKYSKTESIRIRQGTLKYSYWMIEDKKNSDKTRKK